MQYLRSKTEVLHTTSPAIIFCPNWLMGVSMYGYNIAPSS
jgi:hypothetical protein